MVVGKEPVSVCQHFCLLLSVFYTGRIITDYSSESHSYFAMTQLAAVTMFGKQLEFNWRLPVPEELQTGVQLDRIDEVREFIP